MLRYRSTGELHKDFHRMTCRTLHYLQDNYGDEALRTVLRNTACGVYRTMHEKLCAGDASELLEFWDYYLEREKGDYSIEELDDEIRLVVTSCPMLRHLAALDGKADHIVCQATAIFNEALCEDSPFESQLEVTGEFSCIQTLKKKVQL